MSHTIDMNLILDGTAMARLGAHRRRKVNTLVDRVHYLTSAIRQRFDNHGWIDDPRMRERGALRWALWQIGVVIADAADPEWTREHGGDAVASAACGMWTADTAAE